MRKCQPPEVLRDGKGATCRNCFVVSIYLPWEGVVGGATFVASMSHLHANISIPIPVTSHSSQLEEKKCYSEFQKKRVVDFRN